jgi:hypothetical protein
MGCGGWGSVGLPGLLGNQVAVGKVEWGKDGNLILREGILSGKRINFLST